MDRKDRIVMLVCAAAFLFVATLTFVESLPLWCRTPDVGGNWIVAPLC